MIVMCRLTQGCSLRMLCLGAILPISKFGTTNLVRYATYETVDEQGSLGWNRLDQTP